MKDAARGGSVNEGRMVKTPTSTYIVTQVMAVITFLQGFEKKKFGITKRVKKGLFLNRAGGLLTLRGKNGEDPYEHI